jgi:aqualysin 1
MKNTSFARLLALSVYAAAITVSASAALGQPVEAPATHPYAQSRPIPGRYIVVFKDSVANPAAEAATVMRGRGGRHHHTYSRVLKGFAASLSDTELQAIRNNPQVDYIEQDQTVTLSQVQSPENQATWGLDRIDQADRPLDTQYHFNYTGAGVNAFIIDTGIRPDHVEFSGRLLPGFNVIADTNGTSDCNGHGTHVAGTVGGATWGVAKGVSLIPVRVLDCSGSGSSSGVIAGIDWVANSPLRPAVANLSLGGAASASLDAAVAGAVSKGVSVVVAAGNNNADACNFSPSREPSAITVGASTSSDARATYSNFGSCLDLFGPGSSITSAWNTSATATSTLSGTSMASPHVTGVVALALAANPAASPAALASALSANATANRLALIGAGSPNRLVYSLAAGAPTEQANQVVAVQSLLGSAAKTGSNWQAFASVTIRNVNTSAPIANATVSASFSPGGSASCVTGSGGACSLGSAVISQSSSSTQLTVTNLSGTGLTYDSSQNAVAQIKIRRP